MFDELPGPIILNRKGYGAHEEFDIRHNVVASAIYEPLFGRRGGPGRASRNRYESIDNTIVSLFISPASVLMAAVHRVTRYSRDEEWGKE